MLESEKFIVYKWFSLCREEYYMHHRRHHDYLNMRVCVCVYVVMRLGDTRCLSN